MEFGFHFPLPVLMLVVRQPRLLCVVVDFSLEHVIAIDYKWSGVVFQTPAHFLLDLGIGKDD